MKVLVVGAGGVGSAFARIAAQRDSFEKVVVADYDGGRAERAARSAADHFSDVQLDASDELAITELLRSEGCDAVLNVVDPRFVMPVFRAARARRHDLRGHGDVTFAPPCRGPLLEDRSQTR